jgi:hypothetical protein
MPARGLGGQLFRFADVFVALAIFAILGLLTVPAIRRVVEARDKMKCMDNLRRVAIASHHYHNDYNRLPPGWLGPNPDGPDASQSPQVGVLVHLLPYLGNDELYKRLWYQREPQARTNPPTDPKTGEPYDPPSNVPWWKLSNPSTGVSNLALGQTRIPVLICPADDPYAATEGTIVGVHLHGSAVPADFLHPAILQFAEVPEARNLGRTNYLAVAGCVGKGKQPVDSNIDFSQFVGIFTNRSDNTLGQIAVQDGTSNTLMFGESCGGNAGPNDQGRAYAFSWFAGALPTYHGMPRGKSVPWYAFSSRHRHVVQFAYADCSVGGLRRGTTAAAGSPDWWLLQQLAGRRDGMFEIVADE